MIVFRSLVLFFLGLVLSGCASVRTMTHRQAMQYQIARYAMSSKRSFTPYLAQAGLTNPPNQLAIVVFKHTKQMEIYGRNNLAPWRFIRRYEIKAASGHEGPKLLAGDKQVPEGIYHINSLNPQSMFDLSMRLNYPNRFDRMHAQADGRTNLGGNIFIHGSDRSIGCIAIGNTAIQQLFPLVYKVGIDNTVVVIAPEDFRVRSPHYNATDPKWVAQLYASIRQYLQQFPVVAG